ncbi:DUF2975 domain-containing protein [Streptomyces sp. NPDC001941]|uniref:DUF2975 domain-containing protein n=1 Tax=Streptomyces sp. NPDC001941 TaxID=3154659 RepID=UPI00332A2E29
MQRLSLLVLRAGIVAAVLLGLFGQIVVIPTTAADEVDRFPPYAPLAVPYVTVAILGVACVQVALGALWMLLSLVERGTVFSSRALRWVDLIIGASVAATLLTLGVAGHLALASVPSPGDGMEVLGALGLALAGVGAGAGLALLLVIGRGLLRRAADLQGAASTT